MFADKLKGDPDEGRTEAGQADVSTGEPLNGPSKSSDKNSPGHGDQEQDAPSAGYGEAAVNSKNRGDPRHGRKNEK